MWRRHIFDLEPGGELEPGFEGLDYLLIWQGRNLDLTMGFTYLFFRGGEPLEKDGY